MIKLAIFLVIVLVVAKEVLGRQKKNGRPNDRPFTVGAKTYFFSKAESAFYQSLLPIATDLGLTICPKVGLTDLFYDGQGAERHQANRYKQKHVDFLLLKGPDYRPVLGIELDGRSHEASRQAARDQVKDQVFRAAKLPLLRFQNQRTYDQADMRRQMETALTGKR